MLPISIAYFFFVIKANRHILTLVNSLQTPRVPQVGVDYRVAQQRLSLAVIYAIIASLLAVTVIHAFCGWYLIKKMKQ